jgi:hypothetical protein
MTLPKHQRSYESASERILRSAIGRPRLSEEYAMPQLSSPNAAVQRPRAAPTSAARAHNEMTRLRRARVAVSRSAATAC